MLLNRMLQHCVLPLPRAGLCGLRGLPTPRAPVPELGVQAHSNALARALVMQAAVALVLAVASGAAPLVPPQPTALLVWVAAVRRGVEDRHLTTELIRPAWAVGSDAPVMSAEELRRCS